MDNIFKNIQQEKCPVCKEDNVFQSKGNVFLLKMPIMKDRCSNCDHRFEKEPGYFTGAMYVSYGLCIIEMISILLLFQAFAIHYDYLFYSLSLAVILLWPFNFRMSRIIWMYLI